MTHKLVGNKLNLYNVLISIYSMKIEEATQRRKLDTPERDINNVSTEIVELGKKLMIVIRKQEIALKKDNRR